MKNAFFHNVVLALSILATPLWAMKSALITTPNTSNDIRAIRKIASAIRTIQPYLKDAKYTEYASAIYRASQRYRIDPHLLIAIAQQESSFQEKLREGAAGELGMCQIRKVWVTYPTFKEEFGNVPESELKKPSSSFMVAAWILSGLREKSSGGTLPYWSFYNSTKFHNRFKYYVPVNRYIVEIKKSHGPWVGTKFESDVTPASEKYWVPKTRPMRRIASPKKDIPVSGWIAAALKKLDQQDKAKNPQAKGKAKAQAKNRKKFSAATMQAAAELNVVSELLTNTGIKTVND